MTAFDINMSVCICMFKLPCKILTRTRMRLAPACFSNICGKDKEIGYFDRIFVSLKEPKLKKVLQNIALK